MGDKMRRMCGECDLFEESLERSKDGLSLLGVCAKDCKQKESLAWCEYDLIYYPKMARNKYIKRMKKLEYEVPIAETTTVIVNPKKRKKKCEICGKEFNAYVNEKRCSEECKRKGKKITELAYSKVRKAKRDKTRSN